MGSRNKIELAYIAGFLDGDGSLMLQVKKRKDGSVGIRLMSTICFYQDTRHDKTLYWIKEVLGSGYISKRNDGMTELRINGFRTISEVLKKLIPYIRFKKPQAMKMIESLELLSKIKFKKLTKTQLASIIDSMIFIQNENYQSKKKKTRKEFEKILNLTP